MHLLLSHRGELSLEDIDNMKAFSIIDKTNGSDISALLAIAQPAEDNHFWIDAEAVVALSDKADDEHWVTAFGQMLAMVEKYGYSDMNNKRVKAHLE